MPEEHTSTVSWADADPSVTVTTTVPYPPSDLGVTVKVAEVMPLASVLPLTTSPRSTSVCPSVAVRDGVTSAFSVDAV